ncbi:MAG: hypothetical protein ABIW46_05060, partial [Acidimicrobiales bacterium]
GTVAPWLPFEHHLLVLRGLWEHDTSATRRATTHPVLLLTADDGLPGKRDDVARAAAEVQNVETVWMKGDHDLHAQHPAAVADHLRRLA